MYELAKIAAIVQRAADDELMPRFANVTREYKKDKSVVTEADTAIQHRLERDLLEAYPDTAFLGEEMTRAEQEEMLHSGKPLWCVDPVDGTSNFANGIPYFSTSVALIIDGDVKFGVVYNPVRNELFTASETDPAALNGREIVIEATGLDLGQTTAIIDFKRLEKKLAASLASEPPFASQRSFGSIALDWCWLAMGRGQVYLHGKQNLWDYAAGHFIYQRAGGLSETVDGEPLYIRKLEPRVGFGAVDRPLFKAWKKHILDILAS